MTARYSFVVPIYNDGALAERFCLEFETALRAYLGIDRRDPSVELIFVDDGSRDDSVTALRKVCDRFAFARAIVLSRNFGQHIAISCGYREASGDYVGMLNVDMEDPPDQIPRFLELLRQGEHDIVYGLYQRRRVPLAQRLTSAMFNTLLNWLTGTRFPLNTSTLRVMNRRFVDAYNGLAEKSRYIPGLELWLGFRHGFVQVRHQPRMEGRSSYNLRRRLGMALESIISFSDLPLRLVVGFGFLVFAIGFALLLSMVIEKASGTTFFPGYVSTVSIVIIIGGIQILVIGLASLYVGRILREVQNRPLYIVRETYRGPGEDAR